MEKQVRAQRAREAYRRLIRLLEIYFEGPVLIMSEQVDEAYIRLPRFFRGAVNAKGFEKLQRAFPKELPESLHSVKFEDAATEWEHTIRPAMDVFMGKLLQFCVEVGAGPVGDMGPDSVWCQSL